jgi:Domain of unknown function (DUF5916)/Carbohydrate family 9 binding domain-like
LLTNQTFPDQERLGVRNPQRNIPHPGAEEMMQPRNVRFAVLSLTLTISSVLSAQDAKPRPTYQAVRASAPVVIDADLSDAAWSTAPEITGFTQQDPEEGKPAKNDTVLKVVYDDNAVYFGAFMKDDGKVTPLLARRDSDLNNGDYIRISIDSQHDRLNGAGFVVNASNVQMDMTLYNDIYNDNSWDAVWESAAKIVPGGWIAEVRIPYSQLRFPDKPVHTWGFNISRWNPRTFESTRLVFTPKTESGFVSRFADLTGIEGIRPKRAFEVMPYGVARTDLYSRQNNPFISASEHRMDAGVDVKYGLTSSLTLTGTINPDFGQVEVDPAVVNLSAFETSFEERRPFFVEGAGYFGLGGLSCFFCSNVSSLSMISTRRIGRPPQISPFRAGQPVPVDFADMPENSTILGAAKLTGRTRGGWSIGALDAVTRRERAPVQFADSSRGRLTVEPLSNYFATRIARDVRGGATVLKAMLTSVYRDLDEPYIASRLSRHSEAFGVSSEMWWSKRQYRLMAQLAGTRVSGDTAALRRIRFGSAHFFQRPDRTDPVDALRPRSSMTGLGGYARFSRESGKVLFEVSGNFRTPAFNNNDITFFSRADYVWLGANIFPIWNKPSKWYRQAFLIGGGQRQYNFDGDKNDEQLHLFGQIQTLSYWWLSSFWIHRPDVFDDRLTRGGPVVRRPGIDYFNFNASTDSRKKIVANFGADRGCNNQGDCDHSYYVNLELRPASNMTLSIGPSVGHSETGFQFVDSYADAGNTAFYGRRYLFGRLEQNSVSMDTRFNVTFSPTLTLELFMQPLVAAGEFSRYNEFAAPRSINRLVYGEDMGTVLVTPDPGGGPSTIEVDADAGGPAPTFSFADPSFTFRSLRGNAVVRWEYRPGSTIFVVWTRSGSSSLSRGQIDFGDDVSSLWQGPSENIFLIKVNYWLGF